MRVFDPTPEQARAIEHAFADACVVAGAGSGKTAVLTRRFLHLVREHDLDVRRIAALTFTEKAAGEMRERIAQALDEAGLEVERDEVEFAPIATIHAYCARLLRTHAVEAGVDPAFAMLDEVESALLREDAFDLARRELEARGSTAGRVLGRIAAAPGDLVHLYERLRGAGRDPEELAWCAGAVDAEAERREVEESLAAMCREGASVPELVPRLESARQEVAAALADGEPSPWRWFGARDAVLLAKPDGRKRGPKPYQTARKALTAHLEGLARAALDDLGAHDVAPDLREFLAQYDRTYARLKDERGALDFTDLERLALRLLETLAAKGRVPAGRPLAFLVDEYQDTNPLQARLLAQLRAGNAPFFSVGDPKQSIYRFRRADVRVIQREWGAVTEAGRHLLRATFRARPPLVDVLNGLNERLFEGGAAGAEHAPLEARGAFRDAGGPDVEMTVVDVGSAGNVAGGREGEARWIAKRIQALLDGDVRRTKIEVDERGAERGAEALRYGDVAILLRARTDLQTYEDALAAEGIPFKTHKGRGYFQAEEIVDLLAALRVVHDPADDHAFACLLTGPILGGTDEDLLRFFPPRSEASRTGKAWDAFRRAAPREPDGRFDVVCRRVERLRKEALAGRLAAVVEGVLLDLGLLETALLQDEGARRAANLRKAVQVARDLERTGRHDLGDLLRHLTTLRDREVAEAEAVFGADGGDAVQINTVHGAKGLEYPVVFLADVGRVPPPAHTPLPFDPDRGFSVRLRHPLEGTTHKPGSYEDLVEDEARQQAEESLRLLYVGMTRAEERLFLTGTCTGLTKKDGRPSRFLGWGQALIEALGRTPSKDEEDVAFERGSLRLARVDPPAAHAPRPAPTSLGDVPEGARIEASRVLAEAEAEVDPLGNTPFVVTVTDLLRFARSPADLYRSRLDPRLDPRPAAAFAGDADDPQSGFEHDDPEAARHRVRRELFDEEHESPPAGSAAPRVDRAALGRALHALIERLPPGADEVGAKDLERVLGEEFPAGTPEGVVGALREMIRRFAASPTGRRVAAAGAGDLEREIAFHARIRFPKGERVGPFESLLVRGSIDLWLRGSDDGISIVDHKTNPPSATFPTPASLAAHYDWQLRLYALAAERILGHDVAGARLLLLDPGWGPEAVEVPVDVSGEALEDARRLCRAYAVAELEGRWPDDWRTLFDDERR